MIAKLGAGRIADGKLVDGEVGRFAAKLHLVADPSLLRLALTQLPQLLAARALLWFLSRYLWLALAAVGKPKDDPRRNFEIASSKFLAAGDVPVG